MNYFSDIVEPEGQTTKTNGAGEDAIDMFIEDDNDVLHYDFQQRKEHYWRRTFRYRFETTIKGLHQWLTVYPQPYSVYCTFHAVECEKGPQI